VLSNQFKTQLKARARAVLGALCKVHPLQHCWNRQQTRRGAPGRGPVRELPRGDPGPGPAENCCPRPAKRPPAPCRRLTLLRPGDVGFPRRRGERPVMVAKPPEPLPRACLWSGESLQLYVEGSILSNTSFLSICKLLKGIFAYFGADISKKRDWGA